MISRSLYPHVKSILGVDISDGMVSEFNANVLKHGLDPSKIKAVQAELGKDLPAELEEGNKFDVIVVSIQSGFFIRSSVMI